MDKFRLWTLSRAGFGKWVRRASRGRAGVTRPEAGVFSGQSRRERLADGFSNSFVGEPVPVLHAPLAYGQSCESFLPFPTFRG
jgi:hypothetical protein